MRRGTTTQSTIYERQAQLVRDAGALAELPIHLQSLALERAWLGDLSGARRLMAESESISTSTGVQVSPFALLNPVLAGTGNRGLRVDRGCHRTRHDTRAGHGVMVAHGPPRCCTTASGVTTRRHPRPEKSSRKASFPGYRCWALFELVEAAARIGDTKLGCDALDRLAATTRPAGTSFALGIEARSRALLASRRRCRGVVSRGDRAVQPNAAPARTRAHASRLRRVAASQGPAHRCARAAARVQLRVADAGSRLDQLEQRPHR